MGETQTKTWFEKRVVDYTFIDMFEMGLIGAMTYSLALLFSALFGGWKNDIFSEVVIVTGFIFWGFVWTLIIKQLDERGKALTK